MERSPSTGCKTFISLKVLLRLLTGKPGDNPVCHNTFILLQVFFSAEIPTLFPPTTIFWACSAQQHVWTLAVMHKNPHILEFSSRGTYCTLDLIKSISLWQTSSCNADTIKRRRRGKHPVSAATAKKHRGGGKRSARECDP